MEWLTGQGKESGPGAPGASWPDWEPDNVRWDPNCSAARASGCLPSCRFLGQMNRAPRTNRRGNAELRTQNAEVPEESGTESRQRRDDWRASVPHSGVRRWTFGVRRSFEGGRRLGRTSGCRVLACARAGAPTRPGHTRPTRPTLSRAVGPRYRVRPGRGTRRGGLTARARSRAVRRSGCGVRGCHPSCCRAGRGDRSW